MKLRSVMALIVCCLILIRLVQPVKAAGTVSNCASYGGAGSLQNALTGGGHITFTCSGTIVVPMINIVVATTLDATGQTVILDGNNGNSIFMVTAPLVLEHLTLQNGSVVGGGGAVENHSTTQIRNSTFTGNSAVFGAAIDNGNDGIITITNSTISGNTATNGAGIYNLGQMNVVNTVVTGNSVTSDGAGIYNNSTGNLVIQSSTISNNTAAARGGGIFTEFGARTRIIQSDLTGNSAATDGAALFESAVGGGGTTSIVCTNIVGNGGGAVYAVANVSTVSITARANWWGDAAGPSGAGSGAGDSVSVNVDFSGFLPVPATPGNCSVVKPSPPPAKTIDETVSLCADLDGATNPVVRASLPSGTYGVYCRIIAENRIFTRSPAEVGVQSVLDRGVIHAVDIFSPSNASAAGVLICLQGAGDLIFLDAAGAPRVPQLPPVQAWDGFSCTTIPNVGTVVLVDKQ